MTRLELATALLTMLDGVNVVVVGDSGLCTIVSTKETRKRVEDIKMSLFMKGGGNESI